MDQNMNEEEMEIWEDPEALQKAYAKTMYVMREARKDVLRQYEVEDEASLLEKIKSGSVAEHPGYDHYLSARVLEQMRIHVRNDLVARFGGADKEPASDSVHLLLKDQLEAQYAERLAEPVVLAQDAMQLSFDTGLVMEVRYYSADEYLFSWRWGDAQLRIDTAPAHPECPTFPHHLHGDDGTIRADSVTLPGTDCWTNFSRLLEVLLVNPLLE